MRVRNGAKDEAGKGLPRLIQIRLMMQVHVLNGYWTLVLRCRHDLVFLRTCDIYFVDAELNDAFRLTLMFIPSHAKIGKCYLKFGCAIAAIAARFHHMLEKIEILLHVVPPPSL